MRLAEFWEGFDAGVDYDFGLYESVPYNPYPYGSYEWTQWQDGFNFSEGET